MRDRASPARLIIADDHALVRGGVRAMLARAADIEVVAEARDGREALELCRLHRPDLVLMDVRMPEMDGLQATRALKQECPQTAVLMVTSHEDPEYLLDAIRAGAAGYVLKEATKGDLLGAVRGVLGGESPMDRELSARLLRRLAEEPPKPSSEAPEQAPSAPVRGSPAALAALLTPRETEVLVCLASGKTNRQIAKELHLSLSTVKRHLEHVLPKLKVSDRTQAAVKAVEMGLLPPAEQETSATP